MTMSAARRPGAAAPGLRLKLVLTFYVLAAALLPLAHHDIVCHLKSSTHCTSCNVGSAAESAAEPAVVVPSALNDAGAAASGAAQPAQPAPICVCSGRAPPAIA